MRDWVGDVMHDLTKRMSPREWSPVVFPGLFESNVSSLNDFKRSFCGTGTCRSSKGLSLSGDGMRLGNQAGTLRQNSMNHSITEAARRFQV